jgi:hypothetical protein
MSKGWILLVEKWSVDCVQKEAISVQLHLDAEQLSRQLQASECTSSRSGGEPLFGFPLAFSPDLSKIAALTTIYQLEGCRNAMKGIDHSEPAIALPLAEPPKGFYHDYRFTFSNDNRRIAYQQVLRSGRNVDSHREIGVFELADDGAVHQVYQHTAPVSKYIQFDIVNYQFQAKSLQVAIHPTLPLIGWSTLFMGTYISCFSPKNR